MKHYFPAIFAFALLGTTAYAANLEKPVGNMTWSKSTSTDWNGFYAGFSVGAARTYVDVPDPVPPSKGIDGFTIDGPTIGAQAGANAQFGNVVVGAEADVESTAIQGIGSITVAGLTAGNDAHVNALGSFRLRAGFTTGDTLFYGTAGVAVASLTSTAFEEFGGARTDLGTATRAHLGYAVGAGIEKMISDKVSVKGEYLFEGFNARDYDFGAGPVSWSMYLHTIRAGVNFHF